MFEENIIEETDAIAILNKDESHFFDITRKEGDGRTVQKKCCAFSNTDGGELLIGIFDNKEETGSTDPLFRWNGFLIQEDANAFIRNILSLISPEIGNISMDFLKIKGHEHRGKVLQILIEKSPNVHRTSEGKVFVRKGAQCIEIDGQAIIDLQLAKGATSFENQTIGNYFIPDLYESNTLINFLKESSPRTTPEVFLKKQKLIQIVGIKESPIYAGVLLYEENPSIVLPKKCAIKITRYNTSERIPLREHLQRQETVEAPLIEQIEQSIGIIQQMIESVPIMGPKGLEKAKYPPEAIKEVLVNAVIHRDYNISDDVLVFIYNNRIEVHSPGTLPGNITVKNILNERFARNPKIVRLLNKYPNAPNKDIGEGLNTAFEKMKEVRLKEPTILPDGNKVVVILPHEPLASPEEQILEYLQNHSEINNKIARELTGIHSENVVKNHFYILANKSIIEKVPEKHGRLSAWRLKK